MMDRLLLKEIRRDLISVGSGGIALRLVKPPRQEATSASVRRFREDKETNDNKRPCIAILSSKQS